MRNIKERRVINNYVRWTKDVLPYIKHKQQYEKEKRRKLATKHGKELLYIFIHQQVAKITKQTSTVI